MSAGVEKLPLVVIQKCSRNVSRNALFLSRDSAMSMRHREKGSDSPRCPRMSFTPGCFSKTPERTRRMPCVAVSTVKPHAAVSSAGNSFR